MVESTLIAILGDISDGSIINIISAYPMITEDADI
jgi:hypothetical protein